MKNENHEQASKVKSNYWTILQTKLLVRDERAAVRVLKIRPKISFKRCVLFLNTNLGLLACSSCEQVDEMLWHRSSLLGWVVGWFQGLLLVVLHYIVQHQPKWSHITHNNKSSNPFTTQKMSEAIDRLTTCPFLLRCFWKLNRHNNAEEYHKIADDIFPGNEVQMWGQQHKIPSLSSYHTFINPSPFRYPSNNLNISLLSCPSVCLSVHLALSYMWPDSTLREVAEALRLVVAPALTSTSFRAQTSKLAVSVVFLSQEGRTVFKQVRQTEAIAQSVCAWCRV